MRWRCGGHSDPAPPAPASARTAAPAAPDPDAIPVGFGGVLPAPGTALTLHPGTEFLIPVMADADLSDYVRRSGWTGIPVRVVTDAPADVLSVSGEVSAQGWEDPALLAIRVLEPVEPAGFDQTYEVRLEPPAEGFPSCSGCPSGWKRNPSRSGSRTRGRPRWTATVSPSRLRGPFAAAMGVPSVSRGSGTSAATTDPPT